MAAMQGAVMPLKQLSYGFNARLYKVYRGPSPNQAGSTRWYPSLSKSLLTNPDINRTALLADYDGELAETVDYSVDPHIFAPAVEQFGKYGASVERPHGEQWFPNYRHNERCNVALLDGSVITATEDQLLTPSQVNWAAAKYDGYWRDGLFVGPGTLSDTGLFTSESLGSAPAY